MFARPFEASSTLIYGFYELSVHAEVVYRGPVLKLDGVASCWKVIVVFGHVEFGEFALEHGCNGSFKGSMQVPSA